MTSWTSEELAKIGNGKELAIKGRGQSSSGPRSRKGTPWQLKPATVPSSMAAAMCPVE